MTVTTLNFSDKVGQTITFDATNNALAFDNSVAASDITATDVTAGLQITYHGQSVVLSGMSLKTVTTSNITFANGSVLQVGDNLVTTTAMTTRKQFLSLPALTRSSAKLARITSPAVRVLRKLSVMQAMT